MVVNTNILALNSHRALKKVGGIQSSASEKLSSGLRINKAADDAAGLAISEKMRSQIRGLDQASRNAQDGISLIQTAEGALQETENILQRMRELITQASTDTLEPSDRETIALELDQLSDEIQKTAEKTQFNKKQLIDGKWAQEKLYLQLGANSGQGMSFNIEGMSAELLGVTSASIGDIVRGAYNQSISNQVPQNLLRGEYDNSTFNNLGIEVRMESAANTTHLGQDGKMTLGTGNSMTIKDDGALEIAGTITDTLGNTYSTGDSVEDLAGKSFFSDDGFTTWSFTKGSDGTIKVTVTSTVEELVTPPTSSTAKVNGIEVSFDGNKITTATKLYDHGNNLIDTSAGLTANTIYYDSNGVSLFKTGATDADINNLTMYNTSSQIYSPPAYGLHLYGVGFGMGVELVTYGSDIAITAGSVFNDTGNEITSGKILAVGNYYNAGGELIFEVLADSPNNKVKEYFKTTLTLGDTDTPVATATFDTSNIENKYTIDFAEISVALNGTITLTGATDGTGSSAWAANTNYFDSSGKLIFATGSSPTDIKVFDYEDTPSAIKGTEGIGGIGLQVSGTQIYDMYGNNPLTNKTGAPIPDGSPIASSTMYLDGNGNGLFYSASNATSTGEIFRVTGSETLSLEKPQTEIFANGVEIASGGDIFILNDEGTGGGVYSAAGGNPANKLAQGDTLANGAYYDDADNLLFYVSDGKLLEPLASPKVIVRDEVVFTPEYDVPLEINEDGTFNTPSKVTPTTFAPTTFFAPASLNMQDGAIDDLAGQTFTDKAGNSWTFAKDADNFVFVIKTDASGQQEAPVKITISPTTKGTSNQELGKFVSSLNLNLDNFKISSEGAITLTGDVTTKDGLLTFPQDYNFTTGTDHYGQTFQTTGAIISFNDKGAVSIQQIGATRPQFNTDNMNLPAAESAKNFLNKLASLEAGGASHGEVISGLTDVVDTAIYMVSAQRSKLGAIQNRLEHTIKNLDVSSENLSSAESRIRDTDMAKEMMQLTKANVLQQAATSMLAQANQAPQNVLQLLR